MMSVEPPGGKPTSSLTGLFGKTCACASAGEAVANANSAAIPRTTAFIFPLCLFRLSRPVAQEAARSSLPDFTLPANHAGRAKLVDRLLRVAKRCEDFVVVLAN